MNLHDLQPLQSQLAEAVQRGLRRYSPIEWGQAIVRVNTGTTYNTRTFPLQYMLRATSTTWSYMGAFEADDWARRGSI